MTEQLINLQDQIKVSNATQRTMSIIGGKGTGKTTLLMMLMKESSPVLVYDPLSVIKAESLDAIRIVLHVKDINEERVATLMKVVNMTLKKGKNVVLSFDNMVQEEEIELANMTLPLLNLKHGYVYFDEIHEFVPLHSQSLEVERFVRHCRNRDIGVVMTSQRPAAVHKNVLALTDYLVLFRLSWTHDIKAIKDLLSEAIPKEELTPIIASLPKMEFMEGYVIDYRSTEGNNDEKSKE